MTHEVPGAAPSREPHHGHGHPHDHGHGFAGHCVSCSFRTVMTPQTASTARWSPMRPASARSRSAWSRWLRRRPPSWWSFTSGSVALFADTVHNFADALTAIPLWIAFALGARPATRRYTYGFGRAEDLAGLFVIAMIAVSAVIAGVESVRRLGNPVPIHQVGWVAAAGLIGFIGNEFVAVYRVRVGRRIGSAALVADGLHARTDGFTSPGGAAGRGRGRTRVPLADPIIGLIITAPSWPFCAPPRATCSAACWTGWT